MDEADVLVEQFEASRPRLRGIAYRMLGSRAEADDAVQDVWLRLARTDAGSVDNLGGWLTTVVTRVCLDRLRARRSRPEDAVGDVADEAPLARQGQDPADQALLAESVGAALLVVLDSLAPAERVAFVLHDIFAVPFDEIGAILDRSSTAARQLASRARRRVQGTTLGTGVDPIRQRELVEAFLRAARGGDLAGLLRLLDPDVVLRPDAAAERMGSLRATRGGPAVAGLLTGGARAAQLAIVDGFAGLVWSPAGRIRGVVQFTVVDGRIRSIDVTGDPQRIDDLDIVILGEPPAPGPAVGHVPAR